MAMNALLPALLVYVLAAPGSIFEHAILTARDALANGKLDDAAALIQRAIERDPKSSEAWGLRAKWAEAVQDRDELVYALHKQYGLMVAQRADRKELATLRERIEGLDVNAKDLFRLREGFIDRLQPIADLYEREQRPHSAIRVLQEILALDPEREAALTAIERISALPDPSLADTAKPKDLLADVSVQWIRDRDSKHADWKKADTVTRDNYVTKTNAGYEVLVRSAEAMEQINRFYRIFFAYGDGTNDKRSVPRITLHIFKNRAQYLELGIGPPVEWSGGHFTGSHVETYIGDGGFEECITTLFHEAAHQFVSLATTAVGWLNEGLASFFEGCRILSNGTVLMNMPANHRLFPLVERVKNGWMKDHTDGIEAGNANATPTTAPTFQIILENRYAWGPPWYAPTWGVVYFLFNYQDPADGRFIYRTAFREFVNASGGRMGEGAVENFEKVVLANPQRPTKGLPRSDALKLPRSCDELNEVWKEWLIALADEQSGRSEAEKPYLDWARFAIKRNEFDVATEHFEKALVQSADDVDTLVEFGEHLADRENNVDRATKLVLHALRVLEADERPDEKRIREVESLLAKWDPKRSNLERIHEELWGKARGIVTGYLDSGLPMMAMEVGWRLGTDLNVPGMFELYEKALRASRKSIAVWQLAYNEEDLAGWTTGGDVWVPYGGELWSRFGEYAEDEYKFNFLSYDKVTSGDYSLELEILAERGKSSFCGIVFGRKAAQTFHSVILHPGREADASRGRLARGGKLDLSSFYGANANKVWRNNSVDTTTRGWHKLRLDVIGSEVDVWWDGEFVVTHDFFSVDVLRGSFGLITGPGTAKYRNIRFLARDRNDPAAKIERAIRMEKLEREASHGAIGGSFIRRVPPFPRVQTWVQGGRLGFDERGPVPTLLVFWSRHQNDVIPIDKWLVDLDKRYKDTGLEIISIAQWDNREGLEEYLEKHPLPGSVGIDYKNPQRVGMGETFEAYGIKELPRLVLLDIDYRAYWEGDPGFESGIPWRPGIVSYVEESLDEMTTRRRLKDLLRWRRAWAETGGPALGTGDFATALPFLQKSLELPGRLVPMVGDAQRWMRSLENAVSYLGVTGEILAEQHAEPALKPLIAWAEAMGAKVPRDEMNAARKHLNGGSVRDWTKAIKAAEKARKGMKPGKEWSVIDEFAASLNGLEGEFVHLTREELLILREQQDLAGILALLDGLEQRPAVWLVWHLAAT